MAGGSQGITDAWQSQGSLRGTLHCDRNRHFANGEAIFAGHPVFLWAVDGRSACSFQKVRASNCARSTRHYAQAIGTGDPCSDCGETWVKADKELGVISMKPEIGKTKFG